MSRFVKRNTDPQLVTFESTLFEGEFVLPSLDTTPLGLMLDLQAGDLNALFDWLEDGGADDETIGAIRSLSRDEFFTFRQEWDAASGVDGLK